MRFRLVESLYDNLPQDIKDNIRQYRKKEQQQINTATKNNQKPPEKISDYNLLMKTRFRKWLEKLLHNPDPTIFDLIEKSIYDSGIYANNTFTDFATTLKPDFSKPNVTHNFVELWKHYKEKKGKGNNSIIKRPEFKNNSTLILSKNPDEFQQYIGFINNHPNMPIVDTSGKIVSLENLDKYLEIIESHPQISYKNNSGLLIPLNQLNKEATDTDEQDRRAENNERQAKFNKAMTHEQELNFAKDLLNSPKYRKIYGIRDVLIQSILDFGPNENRNGFLKFANKIKFEMPKAREFKQKALYLYGGYKNKRIDLTHEYLTNPTLWNRSDNDFNKAVNAFEICMSPKYVKNYLKDTSVVDINDFFNGDTIKPTKDILNIVDGWAKGNEYSEDERAQRGSADSTLLKLIGERKWNKDTFMSAVNQALSDTGKFKVEHNRDFYESIINDLFVLPEAISDLDDIESTTNIIMDDDTKGFIKDGKINAAACIKASQYGKTDKPIVVSIPIVKEIYLYYEGKAIKLIGSGNKPQTNEINKILGKIDNQMSELENYPAPPKDKITNSDETIQLIISALDDLEDKNIV